MGLITPLLDQMKKCYECRAIIKDSEDMFCEGCRAKLDSGDLHMTFPGTNGLSDGPSSMAQETHFMRPDVPKEMRRCFSRWEENGKLKREPGLAAKCKYLLDGAIERQQKEGRKIKYDGKDAHLLGGIL